MYILESWNSPADDDLSIARARLAPGQSTEVHSLMRTAERYLVVQGTGEASVGSLPRLRLEPGDVVYVPAGVPQQVTNTGEGDLVFYCLCTPPFDGRDYRRCDPSTLDDEAPGID